MWITLEQIKTLDEIQAAGSINSAAQNMNKAKSAVAYTIKKLEEQLGFQVLDRTSYRIELTQKGVQFLKSSQNLLKESNKLEAMVHKIAQGVESHISLSASSIYRTEEFKKVIKAAMFKFPETDFTFHREVLSGAKMLENDDVDIAIFEDANGSIDQFESKRIDVTYLKLVISSKHPYLELPKTEQKIETLTAYPQIILRSTLPSHYSKGIPKESTKRWTVSDMASKQELIEDGFGWGRIPAHLADGALQEKKLVHLKNLESDYKIPIYICKRKDKPFGKVLQHIWDSF